MRKFLSLLLALAAIAITACNDAPEQPTVVNIYEGDDVTNVYVGDDDSADPLDETISTEIEIQFTTAFSGTGPQLAMPGDDVAMGTYLFIAKGEPGERVIVQNWSLAMLTKMDPDVLTEWTTNAFMAYDYVSECRASIWPSLEHTWAAFPSQYNVLGFANDVEIEIEDDGETVVPMRITCQLANTPVNGYVGMAVMWESSSTMVVDGHGDHIWPSALIDNGSWSNPTVQVWMEAEEPATLQITNLTLPATSIAIPTDTFQYDTLLLDMVFYATGSDVTIWYQELAILGLFTPATSGSQFKSVYMTDTDFGGFYPGEQVTGYAQEGFMIDDPITIPAGQTRHLQIWVGINADTELEPGNLFSVNYNISALYAEDANGNMLPMSQIVPSTNFGSSVVTITN